MPHDKGIVLIILIINCANTICSVSYGQPKSELVKVLSERYFSTKSRLGTVLDVCYTITGLLVASVTAKWIPFTTAFRVALMFIPLFGAAASIASLIYLQSKDFGMVATLAWLLIPSFTGLGAFTKILMMDLVVLLDKEGKIDRIATIFFMKSAHLFGVVLVQIVLPLCDISESVMVRIIAPTACFVSFTFQIVLVFKIIRNKVESTVETPETVADTDPVPPVESLSTQILIISALAFYGGQKHEYKFTYYLLRDDLNLSFSTIRITNGIQYLLFTISLTTCGWWLKTKGDSIFKRKLFLFSVAMVFSIVARAFQTASWYLKSIELVVAGIAISTIAPLSGIFLVHAAYSALGNDGKSGVIISTACKLSDLIIGPFYELFSVLEISPFLATLLLMISSLFCVISKKRVRRLLK